MHDDSHGHSKAAWTGIAVMLLAAAVACYAAVFGPAWLMWAGVGGFFVGGIIWYVLERAGIGSSATPERSRAH